MTEADKSSGLEPPGAAGVGFAASGGAPGRRSRGIARARWLLPALPILLSAVVVGAPQTHAAAAAGVEAPLATLLRGEGTTYPSPGPIAADSTGDGHDGLITGATWVAGDSADTSDAGGQALAFSGTSNYVDIPTAVDLELSRTISVTLDVEFAASPGTQAQVLLQKDPGDGSVSPYAVRVAPSTGSGCTTSSCAAIGLYWGSQWLQSKPITWTTGQWYSIRVRDDGTSIAFSRGASPATLSTLSSVPDPTGAAGTAGSSGSLFLGGGPAGAGADPLSGELQDVQLAVPLTVSPAVSGESLSYTSAPLGTALTITAQINGAGAIPTIPISRSRTSTTRSTTSRRWRWT